jgi:hypothetical protein
MPYGVCLGNNGEASCCGRTAGTQVCADCCHGCCSWLCKTPAPLDGAPAVGAAYCWLLLLLLSLLWYHGKL